MPGNKVTINVRVTVKPKPTPFVGVAYSKSIPKRSPVTGTNILGQVIATLFVIGMLVVLVPALGVFKSVPATPVPMLPSDAQNAEVASQTPAETPIPTPLPSRPDRWPADGIITYGKTVNGWFTAAFDTVTDFPRQFDVWQFTGSKGDVITAKVNVDLANSDQNQNLPALSLAEPPNDFIVNARVPTFGSGPMTIIIPRGYVGGPEPNTEGNFNYVAIVNFTLPKSGTFALVVFSMNTSEGMVTYNLTLTKK